ncbi:toxin [Streptomyces cacaoi]|uniref:toxin n=1 Tax=Streptomyces cacaoi TaxID=1898 RepID=UPI003748E837
MRRRRERGTRRQRKELRARSEATLRALGLGCPRSATEVRDVLVRERNRPIEIVPMALPKPGACGMWIATEHTDVIVHEAETSKPHQEHIILHEFAHMICAHVGADSVRSEQATGLLFPDLDPAFVRGVLMRSAYDTDQEQEAEVMATVLLDWLNRPHERTWPAHSGLTTELDRFLKRP